MIRDKLTTKAKLRMADDKIVLFPTNRIVNHENVGQVNTDEHKKLVDEQTKEFVEGNVDEIAYQLLDKFVAMGIKTEKATFTADLALVIDAIRGLVYRDFKKSHPAQKLVEKMVKLILNGRDKSAQINYNEVLNINHKEHKAFSRDVEQEITDLSEMGGVEFIPDFDFDPDNDNK